MVKLNKRLEIRLDKKTFDLLEKRAKKQNKSIGELIRFLYSAAGSASKTINNML